MDPEPRDLRRELNQALRRCTPKQRKWLRTVAAMAGQKWGACYKLSYSTTAVRKWLRDERTQKVLALQGEIAELDSDLTVERIRREYGRLAFSNLKEFHAPDGSFKHPKDWTEDMFAAVESMEFDAVGKVLKIKLHRKPTALDATARMRGMLVEKHDVTLLVHEAHRLTDDQLEDIARRGSAAPAEPPQGEK